LLDLFIAALEVALAIKWTGLAVYPITIFFKVLTIEEIWFVAEGTGDPLPREDIASGVTIQ
jgi:hypothetical protein